MGLTVGSLFAGIGGLDLGLECAGWETQWQVEIDKQCRQVLRRHWPDATRYEDVTNVSGSDLDAVDLICGGFPCQDLSVAGRRAGLAGERSGLFHEFIRIAREVAPRWILVENVPGLLSSNDGRDFATVLRELTGFWPQTPPDTGWRDSGVCEGPRGRAIWRVLDTQYFGPPQRRRRVFIVVDTSGRCGPEVLLEPKGLPWNPAPSREAGEGVTGCATVGSYRGGLGEPRFMSPTLQISGGEDERGVRNPLIFQCHGSNVGEMGALRRGNGNVTGGVPFVARGFYPTDGRFDGGGKDVPVTLKDSDPAGVLPFDTTQVTSKANRSRPKPGDPCHPLAKGAHPPALAFQDRTPGTEVEFSGEDMIGSLRAGDGGSSRSRKLIDGRGTPRRLTPVETERLQGFPDGWTAHGIDEGGEPVEMADTPRYRMMGNAVSVPVAAWIGRQIMEATDE